MLRPRSSCRRIRPKPGRKSGPAVPDEELRGEDIGGWNPAPQPAGSLKEEQLAAHMNNP